MKAFDMHVSDNPVHGRTTLHIESSGSAKVAVTIRDLLGRSVWEHDSRIADGQLSLALDLSSLPSGSYELDAETEHVHHRSQLILTR